MDYEEALERAKQRVDAYLAMTPEDKEIEYKSMMERRVRKLEDQVAELRSVIGSAKQTPP